MVWAGRGALHKALEKVIHWGISVQQSNLLFEFMLTQNLRKSNPLGWRGCT
jgi:hypothetical protein